MSDNISLIETDKIDGKVQIILRQTNYTEEEAIDKLKEYGFNEISVIRSYLGIVEKPQIGLTSINQSIYKELRSRLDSNMRNYNYRVERGEAKKI